MMRCVRITRNGDSCSVNLPKPVLAALAWKRGDTVALVVSEGRVVIQRVDEEGFVLADRLTLAARPIDFNGA